MRKEVLYVMLAELGLNGWDDQCGAMAGWSVLVCIGFLVFFRLAAPTSDPDYKLKRRTGYGLTLFAWGFDLYTYLGPGWGC